MADGTLSAELLARDLIQKTLEFGADLAGFAGVCDLLHGPSETLFPKIHDHTRDHFAQQITTGLPHGAVSWGDGERTVLVFAVRHPEAKPEMDWWYGEINPPGNKLLAEISKKLKAYIGQTYPDIQVFLKPYHVEKGGIYLKDAAVAAGLGCIGKNNLLITPEYGPRVRLRAIGLSVSIPSGGPIAFDPCVNCAAPCVARCPQRAFSEIVYTPEETGLHFLPGRNGSYRRKSCVQEMEANETSAPLELAPAYSPEPIPVIRYCRNCEFNCVIGKGE